MMGIHKRTRMVSMKLLLYFLVALGVFAGSSGFPAASGDDRYLDREFAGPGGHQLANWLISLLLKRELGAPVDPPAVPYRMPPLGGKRNSELTSSIMGIPRTMIDNGRKK